MANYDAVVETVEELGLEEVIHITDMEEIMKVGVMIAPRLVIDGKVTSTGRALSMKQAKKSIDAKVCCGDRNC